MSAAGTVCESMIAAVGHRSRPARTRSRSRSASRMRCHAPLRAQRAKTAYTVAAGGNSTGSCRHAIPPRTMYRMASTITRRQCFSGRPPRPAVLPGAGNSGSRIAHSASVTDDEYTAQPCPPAAWGGHDGHGEIGDDGIVGSWSGRGLGNHRPNQEPTSSVLREAHARPSRVLKHSLTRARSYPCCPSLIPAGPLRRIPRPRTATARALTAHCRRLMHSGRLIMDTRNVRLWRSQYETCLRHA